MISSARDITTLKEYETELKQSALFANLNPAPVLRFDLKDMVLSSNPATLKILDVSEVNGKSIDSLFTNIEDVDYTSCILNNSILIRITELEEYVQIYT